jgi:DHA2 family multidrug resistance protein-like MFS transporter
LMTPWPAVIIIVAPLAGVLSDRYPPGILCSIGLVLMGAGLVALAGLPHDPHGFSIIWRMGLCGAGFGLFQSPNNRTILSSAPPERSGGASGIDTARHHLVAGSGRCFCVRCLGNECSAHESSSQCKPDSGPGLIAN